jgi:hypothetical protein
VSYDRRDGYALDVAMDGIALEHFDDTLPCGTDACGIVTFGVDNE